MPKHDTKTKSPRLGGDRRAGSSESQLLGGRFGLGVDLIKRLQQLLAGGGKVNENRPAVLDVFPPAGTVDTLTCFLPVLQAISRGAYEPCDIVIPLFYNSYCSASRGRCPKIARGVVGLLPQP